MKYSGTIFKVQYHIFSYYLIQLFLFLLLKFKNQLKKYKTFY